MTGQFMTVFEQQLGDTPLTLPRRVRWGDCDPAGVVYTPRFGDYVAETYFEFLEYLLGTPLHEKLQELDLGTPMKAMHFLFKRSLWPDQQFLMRTRVRDIRTRSFDLEVDAVDAEGDIFNAVISLVCVHHSVRVSRAIPTLLRQRLESYRDRFPVPPSSRDASHLPPSTSGSGEIE